MDLRERRTKENITKAFIDLRKQKPLEKITVTELSKLAMINKATFYLHYKDIYDLSDHLENELIQSILSVLNSIESLYTDPTLIIKEFSKTFMMHTNQINILFSYHRTDVLVSKLEHEVKKYIITNYPEFQNDLGGNVLVSFLTYGAFFAFINNGLTSINKFNEQGILDEIDKITTYMIELYKKNL